MSSVASSFDPVSEAAPARLPRVSIGMPVYNGAAYMERSVGSLLGQSFQDFELIIVDNASNDGSYQIACSYRSDARVRVYRNDSNIGAMNNFMRARALARGEYFMWAGVDDAWEPDFVARLAAELDGHPEAGVAMSATRLMRPGHKRGDAIVRFDGGLDPGPMTPSRLAMELGTTRKYNYFICGLFRRRLLERLTFASGGNERIPLTELALAASFRYVDDVLYNRQMHEQNYEDRYPDEALSRLILSGFVGDLDFLGNLSRALLTSPVVPLRRKLLIPMVVGRSAVTRVHHRFVRPVVRGERRRLSKEWSLAGKTVRRALSRLRGPRPPATSSALPTQAEQNNQPASPQAAAVLRWEDGQLVSLQLRGPFEGFGESGPSKSFRVFKVRQGPDELKLNLDLTTVPVPISGASARLSWQNGGLERIVVSPLGEGWGEIPSAAERIFRIVQKDGSIVLNAEDVPGAKLKWSHGALIGVRVDAPIGKDGDDLPKESFGHFRIKRTGRGLLMIAESPRARARAPQVRLSWTNGALAGLRFDGALQDPPEVVAGETVGLFRVRHGNGRLVLAAEPAPIPDRAPRAKLTWRGGSLRTVRIQGVPDDAPDQPAEDVVGLFRIARTGDKLELISRPLPAADHHPRAKLTWHDGALRRVQIEGAFEAGDDQEGGRTVGLFQASRAEDRLVLTSAPAPAPAPAPHASMPRAKLTWKDGSLRRVRIEGAFDATPDPPANVAPGLFEVKHEAGAVLFTAKPGAVDHAPKVKLTWKDGSLQKIRVEGAVVDPSELPPEGAVGLFEIRQGPHAIVLTAKAAPAPEQKAPHVRLAWKDGAIRRVWIEGALDGLTEPPADEVAGLYRISRKDDRLVFTAEPPQAPAEPVASGPRVKVTWNEGELAGVRIDGLIEGAEGATAYNSTGRFRVRRVDGRLTLTVDSRAATRAPIPPQTRLSWTQGSLTAARIDSAFRAEDDVPVGEWEGLFRARRIGDRLFLTADPLVSAAPMLEWLDGELASVRLDGRFADRFSGEKKSTRVFKVIQRSDNITLQARAGLSPAKLTWEADAPVSLRVEGLSEATEKEASSNSAGVFKIKRMSDRLVLNADPDSVVGAVELDDQGSLMTIRLSDLARPGAPMSDAGAQESERAVQESALFELRPAETGVYLTRRTVRMASSQWTQPSPPDPVVGSESAATGRAKAGAGQGLNRGVAPELLFVVGPHKTFTSSLVGMLNSSAEVFMLYETEPHSVRPSRWGQSFLQRRPDLRAYFTRHADPEAAYRLLGQRLAEDGHAFRYFGDKAATIDDQMLDLYRGHKTILTLRDLRSWLAKASVRSMYSLDQDIVPTACQYVRFVIRARGMRDSLLVRLEDIVERHVEEASRISAFLGGVQFQDRWWESVGIYPASDPKSFQPWWEGHPSSLTLPQAQDIRVSIAPGAFWDAILPIFHRHYDREASASTGDIDSDLAELDAIEGRRRLRWDEAFRSVSEDAIEGPS